MTIPPFIQSVLFYSGQALVVSGEQLLILFGPVLLIATAMHFLAATIRVRAATLMGEKVHIWLTAPGTVVHELGHALFCVLFGHKIRDISLFRPRKDGVLGYVKHSWNRKNLYQNIGNFFIGTGPIWLGSALIVLITFALFGAELWRPLRAMQMAPTDFVTWRGQLRLGNEFGQALLALFQQIHAARLYSDWHFYLGLYLLFCIGSHVTLSPADLQGAGSGLVTLTILVFVFNLSTLWLGNFALAACLNVTHFGALLTVLLLFALTLNLTVAGVLILLSSFK
ncbi:MAG: M50 family metallopeptidase [Desulfuromonadales bacterium]|nr:M50 family metallopeptidase [Desulfuromonadales bacterium]